ncbi:MAG TPA: hypothetical protein VJ809_09420 [Pirellulales bacterium]|nr:hypothetical protein [Pirellulales bacterium]
MAKRGRGDKANKSEEIRNLIKTGAKPGEIQTALAERGIKVSTSMIYNVKSQMRARRKAKRIGRRRAAANSSAAPTDIKTLARFIRAVHDVGGIDAAGSILRELED